MGELRVWTCNEFRGHWPVGAAAVVVAGTRDEAEALLLDRLRAEGLPQDEHLDMQAVPMQDGIVRILCDGDY